MKNENKIFLKKKRYMFALICIIGLMLITSAYLFFSYERQTTHAEKESELKTIAKLKISQISHWVKERFDDAKILSGDPFIISNIEKYAATKNNATLNSRIRKRLVQIKEESGYEDILLVDAKGKLLLSLEPRLKEIDSSATAFIKKAMSNKKIISSGLFICQMCKDADLDFIAPLLGKHSEVLGAVLLRISSNDYLFPLIEKWPTQSKTSETLIVRKEGDSVLYLNELRHRKNTSLKFRISLTRKDVPEVQAVSGYKGTFEGNSYMGNEILAYIEPIPNTQWFLVAQVDQYEVYANLYFKEIIIASFAILLIVVLSTWLISYYHYRQRNVYRELLVKEKELYKHREEFKTILYSIGDGVITTDANGNVKQMNHAAEELTGWSENDAKGKLLEEVFKIINEEIKNKVENPVQQILRKGIVIGLANHTLLVSKNGKEIPIADSGAPIKNEFGEITGVVLVFRDQTEERTARKTLLESEERYRRLVELSPDAIAVHSEGKFVYVNPSGVKLIGANNESELIGKPILDIIHPDYKESISQRVRAAIEHGKSQPLAEEKFICMDGTVIDVEVAAVPITFYGKTAIQVIAKNITERKRAEKTLRESEDRYRDLVENSNDLICTHDLEGKILTSNPAASRLLGYDLNSILGMNIKDIIAPEFKHEFESYLSTIRTNGKASGLLVVQTKSGEKRIWQYNNTLRTEDVEKPIVRGMAQDITEGKKAEKRLQKVNECFLNFGFDPVENINRLTSLCGELLNSTAALYNRLDQGKLCSWGMWNVQEGYNPIDNPDGHICYDVIKKEDEEIFVVRNLLQSKYAKTDPNVAPFKLQTYVGKAVEIAGTHVGSLCVVFQRDFIPTDSDRWLINIIASAIGTEEERNQSQNELLKFKLGIERSDEGIFMTDPNGKIFYINPAFEKIYGYSKKDVIGNTPRILKSGVFSNEMYSEFWETLLAKKIVASEFVNRTKDGRLINIESSVSPILDNNENILGFLAIQHDITERKINEAKLRDSEERMRVLVEGTPHLFFYTQDTNADVTYVSPSIEKITGYKVEQWIGQSHWFVTNAEVNRIAREKTHLHLNGEYTKGPIFLEIAHANGSNILLEVYETPIIRNNEVVGLQGVAHDITEREETQEKIKMLAHCLECANECISITDYNNTFLFVNDAFLQTYGYTKDELIGKHISILHPGDPNLEVNRNVVRDTIRGGWKGELWNQRKDGTVFPIYLSTSAIKDAKGKPSVLIGVATDITDAKRAQEELIAAKEKAEQSNKLKTEFLAQISHEIRSPMNAVLSFTTFLRDALASQLTQESKEYFDGIEAAGKRLVRTVDLLLNISEMQVGTYEPTFTQIDIWEEILKHLKVEFGNLANKKGLEFLLSCSVSKPLVTCDKYSVVQIFSNLVDNAIKYTRHGKVEISVVKDSRHNIIVTVADTGIGISDEFIDKLFEPFAQEERGYSRRYEGNGLGLALVKKYCDLNNATIDVESKKGKYSKFTVTFIKNSHKV